MVYWQTVVLLCTQISIVVELEAPYAKEGHISGYEGRERTNPKHHFRISRPTGAVNQENCSLMERNLNAQTDKVPPRITYANKTYKWTLHKITDTT